MRTNTRPIDISPAVQQVRGQIVGCEQLELELEQRIAGITDEHATIDAEADRMHREVDQRGEELHGQLLFTRDLRLSYEQLLERAGR